jgi:SAM-dependent methyltransferase
MRRQFFRWLAGHLRNHIAPAAATPPPPVDARIVEMNIKTLGYQMALQLSRQGLSASGRRETLELKSKATRQADIESSWFAFWCSELKIRPIYHRKIWEFCYLLQALSDRGLLVPGVKALGFACGEEPIPSYLAARGVSVLATDLAPDRVVAQGWAQAGQHAGSLDRLFYPELIDRAQFEDLVQLKFVDMTAIPADLSGYDFCWSICSLEHLGSIAAGLDFIENSLRVLKPGGTAIHTTEYNIDDAAQAVDNCPTVLFQRKHLEAIAARLSAQGHTVAPFDFDVGDGPIDHFVDVPPYAQQVWSARRGFPASAASGAIAHLKLRLDGMACTCFGLTIIKRA